MGAIYFAGLQLQTQVLVQSPVSRLEKHFGYVQRKIVVLRVCEHEQKTLWTTASHILVDVVDQIDDDTDRELNPDDATFHTKHIRVMCDKCMCFYVSPGEVGGTHVSVVNLWMCHLVLDSSACPQSCVVIFRGSLTVVSVSVSSPLWAVALDNISLLLPASPLLSLYSYVFPPARSALYRLTPPTL